MSEPLPNYVACHCQHCNGKIEFDSNQLEPGENSSIPCPHCELETTISAPKKNIPPINFQFVNEIMDADVQVELGVDLSNENPPNYRAAVKMFNGAAQKGHAEGQLNLGICYYNGYGVDKNLGEAIKWWHKAAEQGHPKAQFLLGDIYSSGEEITANHKEAAKWMEKAAKQGNVSAQHYLAIVFRYGHGVPLNHIEAYKWANLAAAHGLEAAATLRDDLAQEMTASQIEEAQLRAELETRRFSQLENERNAEDIARQPIPSAVRREVWRRDEGKCQRCGSREKLEYDHIVPVSRGGSNTARNIELLCESCNRTKSASIQ